MSIERPKEDNYIKPSDYAVRSPKEHDMSKENEVLKPSCCPEFPKQDSPVASKKF
jgi:hypothetical protein